jgi:dTDP-4-dehydrorhamnose 3,5-epimerase
VIAGVRVHELESHVDERGSLTEVLRSDWPEYARFGQAILTVNNPGVIRGWHWHRQQTDVIVVVRGRVLLPLYDGRPNSATRGQLEERVTEDGRRFALFVPPGVYHGYRTLGAEPATILNFPDRTYDVAAPDEERAAFDDPAIGYEWREPRRV